MMEKINLKNFAILFAVVALSASILWAHDGVKDPNVMKRMKLMSLMADNVKILGQMMKKQITFDADLALETLTKIGDLSKATPSVFEVNASDSKSEAKYIIWDQFDDFTKLSNQLSNSVVESSVLTYDDLRPALMQTAGACKACHSKYRE